MNSSPSVCLVTAAYSEGAHYKAFIQSCRLQQAQPVILRGSTRWGLGQKIRLTGEFLDSPDSQRYDCFIFCDAFDVILQKPPMEIAGRYLEKHPEQIIFSAEKYCYPDDWKRSIYPPAPNDYRFLNSGFWIATASLAREMFRQVKYEEVPASVNDQQVFTDLFLSKSLPIQLDYQGEYCLCLNGAENDVIYDREAGLVRSRATGSTPGMIHGNGNSKLEETIDCVLGHLGRAASVNH